MSVKFRAVAATTSISDNSRFSKVCLAGMASGAADRPVKLLDRTVGIVRAGECDGEYYHRTDEQKESDIRRDIRLQSIGLRILRLPEKDINNNWEDCLQKIFELLRRK